MNKQGTDKKQIKIDDHLPAIVADGNGFKIIKEGAYELIFVQKVEENENFARFQSISKLRFLDKDLRDFKKSLDSFIEKIDKEKMEKKK